MEREKVTITDFVDEVDPFNHLNKRSIPQVNELCQTKEVDIIKLKK